MNALHHSETAFGPDRLRIGELGIDLDFSGLPVPRSWTADLAPRIQAAFEEMARLEAGAVANPDEGRRVGHYWLRAPELAPEPEMRRGILETIERIADFARRVHDGSVGPRPGASFRHLLHLGIGGSALGPQLAVEALGGPQSLRVDFLDNTDPQGFQRLFAALGEQLTDCLVLVVSKSGGTPETRNGLEEVRARLLALGCDPARHLVAVTGEGSALEKRARSEGWVETFPMWDWVGGRTSLCSAVGLLPLALLGHDFRGLLAGAGEMDRATRLPDPESNPALRLALAWHFAGAGQGRKDMVVLPYRDRLGLFARYLQQLVMESLGKELDLQGRRVEQGLSVFGNKGSTDQHAFVQQLRDGLDNFFATFIVSLEDGDRRPLMVESGVTSGDYLLGFFLGTRRALMEKNRQVLTITAGRIGPAEFGGLIALFERAVGYYAQLVGINAYHQPGVEAGKKAAARVLELQKKLLAALSQEPPTARTAAEWAARIEAADWEHEAHWLLSHLARDGRGVIRETGAGPASDRFRTD